MVNLFTKPSGHDCGRSFHSYSSSTFEISEKYLPQTSGRRSDAELDQFNLSAARRPTPEVVGVRPGNILVPVSNYHALYHLAAVLDAEKAEQAEIVVIHIRIIAARGIRRIGTDADQLFGSIEQMLFTKALALAEQRGKTIRLAVVAGNDMWEGILRAAVNLKSSSIVLGRRRSADRRASPGNRHRLGEHAGAASASDLEIFMPAGQEQIFYLGPHGQG